MSAQTGRPAVPFGVQTGDVTADGAVLWSATDRPTRMGGVMTVGHRELTGAVLHSIDLSPAG